MASDRRDMTRKRRKPRNVTPSLGAQPQRKGSSKNQTAVERSTRGETLTGKVCSKCGQPIRQKDLLHVKTLVEKDGGFADFITPYHRSCWV